MALGASFAPRFGGATSSGTPTLGGITTQPTYSAPADSMALIPPTAGVNFNSGIGAGIGAAGIPTIDAADLATHYYTPQDINSYVQQNNGQSGDYADQSQVAMTQAAETPTLQQTQIVDGWKDPAAAAAKYGHYGTGLFDPTKDDNYAIGNIGPDGKVQLKVKTGAKTGTVFDLQNENGVYAPTGIEQSLWDTNSHDLAEGAQLTAAVLGGWAGGAGLIGLAGGAGTGAAIGAGASSLTPTAAGQIAAGINAASAGAQGNYAGALAGALGAYAPVGGLAGQAAGVGASGLGAYGAIHNGDYLGAGLAGLGALNSGLGTSNVASSLGLTDAQYRTLLASGRLTNTGLGLARRA